ncbi:MAG: RtcB family protein [Myxococcales bacterium]|nr:RtcB family protein [Myxococcales bacterium]
MRSAARPAVFTASMRDLQHLSAKITNHSLEPDWQVVQWFDRRFLADFVVSANVLPDVCPAGVLPNGTAAVVKPDWLRAFPFKEAIADIGCAMSLAEVTADLESLPALWNLLYLRLLSLGKTVLGSGNHFIDCCADQAGRFHILVHVGSRMEFSERETFSFERDYERYVARAAANHREIWSVVADVFHRVGVPLHLPHDTVEHAGADMLLRKGATACRPGDPLLIASSFDDEIIVGRGALSTQTLGASMSHGTGRNRSRAEAKEIDVDQSSLRRRILIPDALPDHSWRLESPIHYRRSADVLVNLAPHIDISARLTPIAFMGGF